MAANAEDSDALVNELLLRFVAAYADQGFAPWPLPDRALGFFRSFTSLYEQSAGPPDRWLRRLADELRRLRAADVSPIESVEESLDLLGVPVLQGCAWASKALLLRRPQFPLQRSRRSIRARSLPSRFKKG